MSDPSTIPQKPPFEETEAYKERRTAFEREMYDALLAYKRMKLDTETKFNEDLIELEGRYDRGEL